jgi:hypothetical protein
MSAFAIDKPGNEKVCAEFENFGKPNPSKPKAKLRTWDLVFGQARREVTDDITQARYS